MTSMICAICLCYLVANLPVVVLRAAGKLSEWPIARLVCLGLYWTQFSLNCVVYAASNKQYRSERTIEKAAYRRKLGNIWRGPNNWSAYSDNS